MANNIDAIKKVQAEIDVLINQLKSTNKELVEISKLASNIGNLLSNARTPKGVNDALEKSIKNNTLLEAIVKEQEATERKYISTIAKKVLIQDKSTKALAKENEEYKILRREQRNQVKAMSDMAGSYTKLSSLTNLLIKRYQDLAVRQAKGEQLTAKETRRLEKLGQVIQKNQTILKQTDAEVGRFQRNVGNYASTFNGLGNAINQLTREAPAFANSLQTGFLAISNNLPILTDQIGMLITKNKELKAEGKPTQSVLGQLAKSFFSLQTAISLGVTLLTLYGKELVEFISNAVSGGSKIRDLAENQKILNDAYKEGAKSASQEIAQLQLLLAVASDKTQSDETRKKAVDKLIESSGGLADEQDRLNILNGDAIELEKELTKQILNKAIIREIEKKIAEDVSKLLNERQKQRELEIQSNKLEIESTEALAKSKLTLSDLDNKQLSDKEKLFKQLELNKNATSLDLRLQGEAIRKGIDAEKLRKEAIKTAGSADSIQRNINFLVKEALRITDAYTLGLDDNTDKTKNNSKEKKEAIMLLEDLYYNTQRLTKIQKEFNEAFEDELKIEIPEIDQGSIDNLENQLAQIKIFEILDNEVKANITDGLDDLSNIISDFTGANGQKFADFFDKIFIKGGKSFEDLADIGTSSLDILGESANVYFGNKIAQYEADIEANNQYYDALLENENITDEERERLERDRRSKEKKIREAQRKEQIKAAKIQKALAIAEIAINLAKTIITINAAAAAQDLITPFALGATGATYRAINIPQAIGLAAAQTAVVLASPLPQFAEGGTMEKDGLMMINDHASGRLEVVERDGKLLMTNERNAIVQGKKGDIIHKDANEYFKQHSDEELIKNLDTHTFNASIQHQNYLINKLDKQTKQNAIDTDKIVKAINKQKTKFNLNQNINIADDLNFLTRLNNTL